MRLHLSLGSLSTFPFQRSRILANHGITIGIHCADSEKRRRSHMSAKPPWNELELGSSLRRLRLNVRAIKLFAVLPVFMTSGFVSAQKLSSAKLSEREALSAIGPMARNDNALPAPRIIRITA